MRKTNTKTKNTYKDSRKRDSGRSSRGDSRTRDYGKDSRGDSRTRDYGKDSRKRDSGKGSFKSAENKVRQVARPKLPPIEVGDGFVVCGRNPVREAILGDSEILAVYIQKGGNATLEQIAELAQRKGVRVRFVEREELDEVSPDVAHQGVLAVLSSFEYADLDEMLKKKDQGIALDEASKIEGGQRIPLLILLDGIEDPHNLGAIIRTAECAGASGVVIPKRHSAKVNETVARTSAGAIEYMPCIQVSNIGNTIDKLKEHGFWVYACDMDGTSLWETKLEGKVALVIGNEGSGVSRLVKEKCDFVLSIPMFGNIDSLNASNASALVVYEVLRQRTM